ncbi:MAG: glycosyltransferase family 39 protein [Candidatus Roizmanbacteria bacterium]|nr:MAG: glycosyltransferase family 39 protein [Candidatus Roizmanbacteria bacterium]
MKNKKERLILGLIILIGAFLRFFNLGKESLWLDEAYSVKLANVNFFQIWDKVRTSDVHPPFYYMLLNLWIKTFGDSEFAVRSLSVVFGILSIFMIYKLTQLLFNKNTGLVAALILALSPFHIQYSQEARMYNLLVFLIILSMYFFVKLLNNPNGKILIGYLLTGTLLMYTHYYSVFIFIAQNIYLFIYAIFFKKDKNLIKIWLILQIVLFFSFFLWILVFIKQIHSSAASWIPPPTINLLGQTFLSYSGSEYLLIMFLILLLINNHFKKSIQNGSFLLIWLWIPIILPYVISIFFMPIYTIKVTIVAMPSFYILVAKKINDINRNFIKWSFIGAMIIFSLIILWQKNMHIYKEQWREVAHYIDAQAIKGDVLLFNEPYLQIPFDYYSKRNDIKRIPLNFNTSLELTEKEKNDLKGITEKYQRFWFIQSHITNAKIVQKNLNSSFKKVFCQQYKNIKVCLFIKRLKPLNAHY